MICTRCDGTGYLNAGQYPGDIFDDREAFLMWLLENESDITVCDCCGDGENSWHGVPGAHFEGGDLVGPSGPYAYNGGLPECN